MRRAVADRAQAPIVIQMLRSLRPLLLPFLLLVGATAVFETTMVDLWVQDHFYDFSAKKWIVDGNEPVGRFVFYNGPKILIWCIGLSLLAIAFGPRAWRERLRVTRRGLWIAILTLATVPALAGLGKNLTNTFCPSEVRRYGGDVPYVRVIECYPENDKPSRRGYCFPAGHASGGFALFGLMWLGASRRWRNGVICAALGLGLWMGTYQMLKGAHYLSHTVTTLLVAWLIAACWRRVFSGNTEPITPPS